MSTIYYDSSIEEHAKHADKNFVMSCMNEDVDDVSEDAVWEIINDIEEDRVHTLNHKPSLEEICNISFLIMNVKNLYQKQYLQGYRSELLNRVKQNHDFEKRVIIVLFGCVVAIAFVLMIAT
jgi:pantothenate kinase